ncbi:DUF4851 domain-containing protein [Desulfovibrio sp. OttesenSCG-928-C06]|nr:DUF4851 domain-containing protein [Desulfovibrio sp. OttesenSCG-928-C06]
MTRAHTIITACLLALCLAGCAAGTGTGLSGNNMLAGGLPRLIIKPAASLEAVAEGNTWGMLKSDTNLQASAKVSYAIYGDKSAQGPVTRHGHVLISRLTDSDSWEYNVESLTRRNEAYLNVVDKNGLGWTEHLLYENSAGDWFSDFWAANGRKTPEVWIGKRWSRTYAGHTRVVVEYREPLPASIETVPGSGYLAHTRFVTSGVEGEKWLKEFHARADAAFDIQSSRGQEIIRQEPQATSLTTLPASKPDMARLVGTVQIVDKIDSGSDWW